MNVLELVPTPANARKLLRFSKVMNLVLDPVVEELSYLERFDADAFYGGLPADIAELATDDMKPVVGFMSDCNWRGLIVANTQHETFCTLLLSALASGMKPITFLVQDGRSNNVNAVKSFLNEAGVKYQEITEHFTGLTEDVVVATPASLSHPALRELRKGVCVNLSGPNAVQHYNLFANSKPRSEEQLVNYATIGYEFKHLMIGIAKNTFVHRYSNDSYYRNQSTAVEWYDTRNFHQAFPALFPDYDFEQLFDIGGTKTLQNAGFITINHDRLAPLLNISIDLIK